MLLRLMMTPCSSISSSTETSRSMAELSAQERETGLTGSMEPREDGGMAVSSSEAEPWSSSSRSLIMPGMLSAVLGDRWADMSLGESGRRVGVVARFDGGNCWVDGTSGGGRERCCCGAR